MKRRSALGLLAASLSLPAGCLSDAPGVTGPRNPPSAPADDPREPPEREPLRITEFDFGESDDGRLRVFGTVENRTETERRATVRVSVTTDETYERTVEVDVPAGSTAEFEVVFDLAYEVASGNFSIDLHLV